MLLRTFSSMFNRQSSIRVDVFGDGRHENLQRKCRKLRHVSFRGRNSKMLWRESGIRMIPRREMT